MSDLEKNSGGIPIRPLGRTGVSVSILGLGGGHIGRAAIPQQEAVRLIQSGIDQGISFMDNAWEYHDGESEVRMGMALEGRRDKVVLMTKVCARDAKTAAAQLDESLTRLRTDVIDVWQFHEVNYDNDPQWLFGPDGAIDAAVKAKQAGKIRFIGFTGHKSPHIFRRMLDVDFDWDTVQMPVSVMDRHYRSFLDEVMPELTRRQIGCIGMKSLGGGGQTVLGAGLTAQECRRYSMSQEISVLVTGVESEQDLNQDLEIARNFTPMTAEEQKELLERVRPVAGDGRFEVYKSTQFYDSGYHRDQHGFPPIGHVGDSPEE